MEITFLYWNNAYFGILPLPNFETTKWFRIMGRVEVSYDNYKDATIFMSEEYDYDQYDIDNIMVHEMIHYYLYLTGEDSIICHGKAFKRMAADVNTKFGLCVSKYYDTTFTPLIEGYSKIRKFFSFLEFL